MSIHAEATFAVKRWDEQPCAEIGEGAKFTRASVAYTYEGSIIGDSTLEYLMFYNGNGSTNFVGLERIVGSIDGRSGSFVLQHSGIVDDSGIVRTTSFVVPDSGTDDLRGLRGEGGSILPGHAECYPFTLDYDFA